MAAIVCSVVLGSGAVAANALAADQTITFPTGAAAGAYAPPNVNVDPGDTVTFNGAFDNHPLIWNGNEFAPQDSGTTNGYTFAQPGLYRFHCRIHPSMVGSVNVSGDLLGTPDFTFAPAAPQAGQAVTFTATAFTDPDGSVQRYEWDLDGDGLFEASGASASHVYGAGGLYTVALRYVDDHNETSSATTHSVRVADATPGGSGSGGAPIQPGAPGSSGSPGNGTPGAGSGEAGATAPRLRIGTRALAFHHHKSASVTLTVPRAAALRATLRRAGRTLATGSATATRAGTKSITLKLTRTGTGALRRARGSLRATLTVVAHPRTGRATTVTKTLTVHA